MAKRFQVVIVGGGPVGVALAVQLGMRGVSCALIESRTELEAEIRRRLASCNNPGQRTKGEFVSKK